MKPLSKSKSESVSSTETQFSRAVYFLGTKKKSKKTQISLEETKIKQVKVDHLPPTPLPKTQRKTNGAKFGFRLNCSSADRRRTKKKRGRI